LQNFLIIQHNHSFDNYIVVAPDVIIDIPNLCSQAFLNLQHNIFISITIYNFTTLYDDLYELQRDNWERATAHVHTSVKITFPRIHSDFQLD
jgi:hypothetical protein